jgi:anti-sigma regulatory factor (Ser/Thr protein kinase)
MANSSVPHGATAARAWNDGDYPSTGYRHEAFLYAGRDELLAGAVDFVHAAADADEPVLVVLPSAPLDALRGELGHDADRALFADMSDVGYNPARLIPAWQSFLLQHARDGRRVRGIGEPIWPERPTDEIVECQRHEALLNVAFAGLPFWLLCPYDADTLADDVVVEARRTHPLVHEHDRSTPSATYGGTDALSEPFSAPLPDAPVEATTLEFDARSLRAVRLATARHAERAGLGKQRTSDLVVAVSEVSTNSVQHGGGHGTLRLWIERGVVCEVRDGGRLSDPMLGRRRPGTEAAGGRGMWLANQLCDLVQVRSFPNGTVVRLHVRAA